MAEISICIPTYNRLQYLKPAILSSLADSSLDVEVLVVDNASDVDVKALVDSIGDARVRYFRNDKNLGMVGNWNRCVELAKGQYFLLLSDDDKLSTGGLKALKTQLDRFPDAGMSVGSVMVVDGDDNLVGPQKEGRHGVQMESGIAFYYRFLIGGCPVQLCATLIRMDILRSVAPFDENIPYCPDMDLWPRAALISDVVTTEDCVAEYRLHSASCTGEQKRSGQLGQSYARLLEKQRHLSAQSGKFSQSELKDLFALARSHFANSSIAIGLNFFKMGDMDEARANFANACKLAIDWKTKIYACVLQAATLLGRHSYGLLSRIKRQVAGKE